MIVEYNQATVSFPGRLALNGMDPTVSEAPKISGNRVDFWGKDFLISARIEPFYVPYGLSENEIIKKEIINPTIELVEKDLSDCDDLLKRLVNLSEKGVIQNDLFYKKDHNNLLLPFKVYDYSTRNDKVGLFKRFIEDYKEGSWRSKIEENKNLVNLTKYVYQENKEIPHVKGNTLKESLERAIQIYNLSDRLSK
jgi:hypothetical protein